MANTPALSCIDHVLAVADRFFYIADLLHRRLNAGPIRTQPAEFSNDLYSLLVEEYGLRARAAILRNDASAHIVTNATLDQDTLLRVLSMAGEVVTKVNSRSQLRSIIVGVSTLCVSISPGKGPVVDFLATELSRDVRAAAC